MTTLQQARKQRGIYTETSGADGYRRLVAIDSRGRVVAHVDLNGRSRETLAAHRLRQLLNATDPGPDLKLLR